jgi:hypothetical protein
MVSLALADPPRSHIHTVSRSSLMSKTFTVEEVAKHNTGQPTTTSDSGRATTDR